jgi:hypothetical protein
LDSVVTFLCGTWMILDTRYVFSRDIELKSDDFNVSRFYARVDARKRGSYPGYTPDDDPLSSPEQLAFLAVCFATAGDGPPRAALLASIDIPTAFQRVLHSAATADPPPPSSPPASIDRLSASQPASRSAVVGESPLPSPSPETASQPPFHAAAAPGSHPPSPHPAPTKSSLASQPPSHPAAAPASPPPSSQLAFSTANPLPFRQVTFCRGA